MIGRHISSKELPQIAKEYEYFFWNLPAKNPGSMGMTSYDYVAPEGYENFTKYIVDSFKIPYFESYIEDEYEFVANLKNGFSKTVWKINFQPIFIGFKGLIPIQTTYEGICYCPEGFVELIYKTNPKFIENVDLD
jgi:hypothetical protein